MASPSFSSRRIVVLLVITALAFMTLDARETGPFAGARSFALSVTSPIRGAVRWVVSPIGSGWQGVVHYDDVTQENDELRARVAELEGALNQVPDNEAELQALRAATKVEFAEQYERVTGQVVSDRQTGLERIVEVNRGSDQGVEVGMPVVTANGLVGQVVNVSTASCFVRVITDPRLRVGVISNRTRVVGVISGTGDGNNPDLDLLVNAVDLAPERTRFETSGFDASPYPAGVPVGTLVNEGRGETSLQPYADIERLSFLTILLYAPDLDSVSTEAGDE